MGYFFQKVQNCKDKPNYSLYILRTAVVVFGSLVLILFLIHYLLTRGDSQVCQEKVIVEYQYKRFKSKDVSDKDLLHVQASDLNSVQKVCDLFDECAAYNSNGWLKRTSDSAQSFQADLYVKQIPRSMKDSCKEHSSAPVDVTDYSDMLKSMKIFVYPTIIGHEHRPHRTGGYAVERKFVEILSKSKFLTLKGEEATFFFIPIRCTSYIISAPTEHQGILQANRLIGEILEEIKTKYPYWSWSNGADHFYICAHEIGAGIGNGVLKNSIALVNSADYEDPYFVPHKDISIPCTPTSGTSTFSVLHGGAFAGPERNVLAFFAGDLQSGRIRPLLYSHWARDDDIVLVNHDLSITKYLDYFKKSKYCLIVRGRESWSPRLVEAILTGCVPVIISNHYHLPLQGIVDWKEFSVIIPESEILQLKTILQDIAPSKLLAMQATLKKVYTHFLWKNPPRSHDAFYSVMLQLWRRRHVTQYRSAL